MNEKILLQMAKSMRELSEVIYSEHSVEMDEYSASCPKCKTYLGDRNLRSGMKIYCEHDGEGCGRRITITD